VPFDNNSDRDLQIVKPQQKIRGAGTTRVPSGFLAIRFHPSIARKQGQQAIEGVQARRQAAVAIARRRH
jgi:hypothetical protein